MNKYNAERYNDPTVYLALTRLERLEKFGTVIYVCSPYSGNPRKNTALAKVYCRHVLACNRIPLAPHLLYPQFMSEEDKNAIYKINRVLLNRCEELWVFGRELSEGMLREIDFARTLNKTIRFINLEKLMV